MIKTIKNIYIYFSFPYPSRTASPERRPPTYSPLSLLLSNIFISNTLNRRRVCMYYLIKYKRLRERGASGGPNRELAQLLTSHSPAKLSRMPFYY